ncbi:hypothetical protein LOTGIDRAFT_231966 [Lottia gigantea]|uniref:Homeobox domain-containing protein n=1 Tax=Lottia gigantea TaxID=225164 RepID=V4AFX1_LOTGI|nr:hypothetical protein LOTGIDRAFT_231966 [Lottia gigantea]ESO95802.1 hypothetical protein LOTGIDRAFT_231966 [Lottia gigantea]
MKDIYGNGRFTDSPVNGSGKKRSRQTFTAYQTQTLEAHFHRNNFPDKSAIDKICMSMDINETRLQNWFKNRRARSRRDTRDGTLTDAGGDGGDSSNGFDDVSPTSSPKRKSSSKPHIGNYSIQKLMEKDNRGPPELPNYPPPRMMTPLPQNPRLPNPMFMQSPQPIRQLHHMTSYINSTPDRSLTSSLSQVLRSQIDHQMTPDMHMRSIRHLEALQCRPFENSSGCFINTHPQEEYSECENPLWDLYYSYRSEIVPVREYFDAVAGQSANVITGEEGQTLLVL